MLQPFLPQLFCVSSLTRHSCSSYLPGAPSLLSSLVSSVFVHSVPPGGMDPCCLLHSFEIIWVLGPSSPSRRRHFSFLLCLPLVLIPPLLVRLLTHWPQQAGKGEKEEESQATAVISFGFSLKNDCTLAITLPHSPLVAVYLLNPSSFVLTHIYIWLSKQ